MNRRSRSSDVQRLIAPALRRMFARVALLPVSWRIIDAEERLRESEGGRGAPDPDKRGGDPTDPPTQD